MTRTHARARSRSRNGAAPAPIRPVRASAGPVRWSRVMTAQARISAGYYERDDVQDLVVTAVLNELRRR